MPAKERVVHVDQKVAALVRVIDMRHAHDVEALLGQFQRQVMRAPAIFVIGAKTLFQYFEQAPRLLFGAIQFRMGRGLDEFQIEDPQLDLVSISCDVIGHGLHDDAAQACALESGPLPDHAFVQGAKIGEHFLPGRIE